MSAISVGQAPALETGTPGNGTVELGDSAGSALAGARTDVLLPGERAGAWLTKRVFDLAVAVVLLILTAPLLIVIGLLIKLDSPGPILFRSRRIGRNGVPFEMLKFRTMVDGADSYRDALRALNEAPYGLFKVTSDPRMTRVGRLLRATCLDELPQLVQVLSGKMSLVGPRPLVPEESSLIPSASLRFKARPGITGPWQVAGSWQVPISEMIELDTTYVDEWSIWLDLKLLTHTFAYAISRSGV